MKTYPAIITPEIVQHHTHISDFDVRADISDTEREIHELEQRWESDKLIESLDRMAAFRVSGYPQRIAERQEFVAFLKRLLAARQESAHA